jgi:uncharacterized protein (TIGR03000 family)
MFLIFALAITTGFSLAGDVFAQRGRWGGGGGRGWGGGWGGGYYSGSYYPYYSSSPYSWSGGYQPYYWGSNYASSPYYYSTPYYSSMPYYSSPYTTTYDYSAPQGYSFNPNVTQSQSSYYNPGPTQQTAAITVFLPTADAKLWFDNTEMKQQGMTRYFSTPSLEPGKMFTYTLKARWMNNGQPVEREKQVNVQAGQQATVDFRTN